MNYKVLQYSVTPFGYPTNTCIYKLSEDGFYYESGQLSANFDLNKHTIDCIEYNGSIYKVGENEVLSISRKLKIISSEIINGINVLEYDNRDYILIKNKDLKKSVWIEILNLKQ